MWGVVSHCPHSSAFFLKTCGGVLVLLLLHRPKLLLLHSPPEWLPLTPGVRGFWVLA